MGENTVLCGANSYEQKYYFNSDFDKLPDSIKDELKIMCVLFTEDIGGGLKIKQLQTEKRDLLESLETFYKIFVLGECE